MVFIFPTLICCSVSDLLINLTFYQLTSTFTVKLFHILNQKEKCHGHGIEMGVGGVFRTRNTLNTFNKFNNLVCLYIVLSSNEVWVYLGKVKMFNFDPKWVKKRGCVIRVLRIPPPAFIGLSMLNVR
jgi:hypothetical protein